MNQKLTLGLLAEEMLTNMDTVYPNKYAHGFIVLCFVVVMQSFIMNSHEVFIHIHHGCFAGTGAIVRLPQCQWSKPDGYGKISQCITTTKHSKAQTACIFLGIYCICNLSYGDKYRLITRDVSKTAFSFSCINNIIIANLVRHGLDIQWLPEWIEFWQPSTTLLIFTVEIEFERHKPEVTRLYMYHLNLYSLKYSKNVYNS